MFKNQFKIQTVALKEDKENKNVNPSAHTESQLTHQQWK